MDMASNHDESAILFRTGEYAVVVEPARPADAI